MSGTISYTQSPVHTIKAFAKLAKQMEDMGVTTVCVKDMAGVMSPAEAYELIGEIKQSVKVPVVLHTHCTTGMAFMTYLKAVEAGVGRHRHRDVLFQRRQLPARHGDAALRAHRARL